MLFLLDINISKKIGRRLRGLGHEVVHASDEFGPDSTPDPVLAAWADQAKAIVITRDADYLKSWNLVRVPAKLIHVGAYEAKQDRISNSIAQVLPRAAELSQHYDKYLLALKPNHVWVRTVATESTKR